MNLRHFATQIDRLKEVFSDRLYPDVRVKILFNALSKYPDHYMERAVNEFVLDSRQAPLLHEFMEKFSTYEDEKQYAQIITIEDLRRASHKSANKEFASLCFGVIEKKLTGKISQKEFDQALQYIEQTARLMDQNRDESCPKCYGSGYALTEDDKRRRFARRCECPIGRGKPEFDMGQPNLKRKEPERAWGRK